MYTSELPELMRVHQLTNIQQVVDAPAEKLRCRIGLSPVNKQKKRKSENVFQKIIFFKNKIRIANNPFIALMDCL